MGAPDLSKKNCDRRRVVIIADNSLIVEAIRIGFYKSAAFDLIGRADGHKASATIVLATQPDVILLDDMGHSERALELIRDLRSLDDGISVIVLSVDTDLEWLSRLFDAGATAAISKATQPIALATLVRETLDGHIYHNVLSACARRGDRSSVGGAVDSLPLTRREREILRIVAGGASNAEVARQLWVTEQTVKFHLRNIYRKLDVSNRTQASRLAYASGLVGEQTPRVGGGHAELAVVAP